MIYKWHGYLKAVSMIHQGGDEKTGSSPVLNTITIYNDEEDEFSRIPIVSANSIRGKLRRMIMYDFAQLIGKPIEEMENMKLQQVLMGGGSLESVSDEKDSGVIDLELRKTVQRNFIPLAIYGISIKNQMIEGKLKCGMAFPVCKEYIPFLPEKYKDMPQASQPVRTFTDSLFFTRRDDIRKEREEDEQAIQMKVDIETLMPGTVLYHWWALDNPTEVELSCFGRMMKLFADSPFLGGKASGGLGNVELHYDPEFPSDKAYLKHIEKNKKIILEMYDKLNKILR